MLYFSKKIKVDYSPIQGRGVFATDTIKKDEVIEECHFIKLEEGDFTKLDKSVKETNPIKNNKSKDNKSKDTLSNENEEEKINEIIDMLNKEDLNSDIDLKIDMIDLEGLNDIDLSDNDIIDIFDKLGGESR